jgi:hypothetical protein
LPPKLYGGTKRIVAYLCDELAALGHDVTLFASGDSVTRARLVPLWPCALRLSRGMRDYVVPHVILLAPHIIFERRFTARRMAEDYLKIYRELVGLHRPLREAV